MALNLFFVIGFQPGHFDFKILGSFLQRSSTDYKKIDMFLHLILSILFEKNLSSDEFFNIIHSEKSNSELKINSKLLGMTYCLVDQLLFILKSQIEIYYTLCKKTESPTSTKNLKLKNLKYVSTFSFENYISSDIIALPSEMDSIMDVIKILHSEYVPEINLTIALEKYKGFIFSTIRTEKGRKYHCDLLKVLMVFLN